jgi:hypothetical protein
VPASRQPKRSPNLPPVAAASTTPTASVRTRLGSTGLIGRPTTSPVRCGKRVRSGHLTRPRRPTKCDLLRLLRTRSHTRVPCNHHRKSPSQGEQVARADCISYGRRSSRSSRLLPYQRKALVRDRRPAVQASWPNWTDDQDRAVGARKLRDLTIVSKPGTPIHSTDPEITGTPAESRLPGGASAVRARGLRVPVAPYSLPKGGTEADDLRLAHDDLPLMSRGQLSAERTRANLALAMATGRRRPLATIWRDGHPMEAAAWLTERLAAVDAETRRRS